MASRLLLLIDQLIYLFNFKEETAFFIFTEHENSNVQLTVEHLQLKMTKESANLFCKNETICFLFENCCYSAVFTISIYFLNF